MLRIFLLGFFIFFSFSFLNAQENTNETVVDNKPEIKLNDENILDTDKFDVVDIFLLLETNNKFIEEFSKNKNKDEVLSEKNDYNTKILNTVKYNLKLGFEYNENDLSTLFKKIKLLEQKSSITGMFVDKTTLYTNILDLATLKIHKEIFLFLNELKSNLQSETLVSKLEVEQLKNIISKYQERLGKIYPDNFDTITDYLIGIKDLNEKEKVLKNSFDEFKNTFLSANDLFIFIVNNPKLLTSSYEELFNVGYLIEKINTFPFSVKVNYYLDLVGIDLGKLSFSLFAFLIFFFGRTQFFNLFDFLIGKFFLVGDLRKQLISNFRFYFEYLIIVFGFSVFFMILLFPKSNVYLNLLFNISYVAIITLFFVKSLDILATEKIDYISNKFPNLRPEIINLLFKLVKGVILIISLLVILKLFGLDISTIVASLGIGGLAIALAAKDSLSNLFSSISILLDNSFKQGDWIKTTSVEGTVVEIGIRSTTIRTFDNALVTVPNSSIANSTITNWNRRRLGRRIKMSIGLTYSSDRKMIEKTVIDIKKMLIEHPGIANDKSLDTLDKEKTNRLISIYDHRGIKNTLLVYLDTLNASSIDIGIYCFSKTVNWEEWLDTKQDVILKIMEIVENNGLEFAFPTQSIWIENNNDVKELGE